jgi:hypothetical protein
MEPRELIYNVYKDITSIKNSFDDTNLWCNPYKTIQGLTPMTPGYVISMEYAPHIDIEEYFFRRIHREAQASLQEISKRCNHLDGKSFKYISSNGIRISFTKLS